MCVFCKTKHSFTLYLSTLYLSRVPYSSTDSQTRSFLNFWSSRNQQKSFKERRQKNYQSLWLTLFYSFGFINSLLLHIPLFLVKQELVVFIQRTLIEKFPIFLVNTLLLHCSHKHSFTPYPSLSPYSPTDGMTDRGMNALAARGLEELFFQLWFCVSFWFWTGNRFWFYILLCTYSTIQLLCCVSFLVLAGNSFWCYVCTQCTIPLCGGVSFLVVAGNRSQNENTVLQKILLGGLLYYDLIADVCIS